MNFLLTEEIEIQGKNVVLSLSNEFNSYFDSTIDYVEFNRVENLEYLLEVDVDIEDVLIITIYSEITGREKSFATDKNNLNNFVFNFIKTLEDKEDYELCAVFTKVITAYNKLINEE